MSYGGPTMTTFFKDLLLSIVLVCLTLALTTYIQAATDATAETEKPHTEPNAVGNYPL